jgi:hypothetical protein
LFGTETLGLPEPPGRTHRGVALAHPNPEETMADEPRDKRSEIRLSQLSHGAG